MAVFATHYYNGYGTHTNTETIWMYGANNSATNTAPYFAPVVRAVTRDVLADLPEKARNAIRLAGLRPPPRAQSELRPAAYVTRTRPVRRELQRSGYVGFARLGGRRPL